MAENAAAKQRQRGPGRPFTKGRSGNPAGKPRGARHRVTLLAEKLMQDDTEAVVRSVVDAAKGGDMTAARLILDRIAPPRRGSPVSFNLPTIETAADISKALGAVMASVTCGELTPDEAIAISGLIETRRKVIETRELETRVIALEQAAQERGKK
jgi:translation elongation factor EF-Tu-like GTPase